MFKAQQRRVSVIKYRSFAPAVTINITVDTLQNDHGIDDIDAAQTGTGRHYSQVGYRKKIFRFFRNFPKTVGKFEFELIKFPGSFNEGNSAIGIDPQAFSGNILFREQRTEHTFLCFIRPGKYNKLYPDVHLIGKFHFFA